MDRNKNFLGTGMKFPPGVNPATGRFEMVSGAEGVKQSVYLILMTQKKERFIHPDFGSELMKFTFMDNQQAIFQLMAADLERDIRRGEPRVDNVKVSVESQSEEGVLNILVNYRVRETNQSDNIVFPFYLKK